MDFLGSVKYKSLKIVLNYIPSLPILYDDKHQTMFFGSAYPQIMLLDQEPVVARLCYQSYGNVSKSLAAAQLASFRGRPDKTTGGENTHTHTHAHTDSNPTEHVFPASVQTDTCKHITQLIQTPLTPHLPVLEVTSSPRHASRRSSKTRTTTDPRTAA